MPKFTSIESKLRKTGLFYIAGIDEAGRGPLAGPVVSASVILKPGTKLKGLDDSKKVTPKKREDLFNKITKNALDYAITIVSTEFIDKYNILNATIYANYLCIHYLSLKPDIILIDGHDKQFITEPHITIIKGDQTVRSIAAASILAKVTRDRLMKHYAEIYPEYGFEKHMGYGTRMHCSNIKKHGLCEIHRKSYTIKV